MLHSTLAKEKCLERKHDHVLYHPMQPPGCRSMVSSANTLLHVIATLGHTSPYLGIKLYAIISGHVEGCRPMLPIVRWALAFLGDRCPGPLLRRVHERFDGAVQRHCLGKVGVKIATHSDCPDTLP